jgi:hypothetical protein
LNKSPTIITGHNRYNVMSKRLNAQTDPSQPMVYQIRLKGHLGSEWTDCFGGLTITLEENGDTHLSGPVVDQAALHGLLAEVRDLGLLSTTAQSSISSCFLLLCNPQSPPIGGCSSLNYLIYYL